MTQTVLASPDFYDSAPTSAAAPAPALLGSRRAAAATGAGAPPSGTVSEPWQSPVAPPLPDGDDVREDSGRTPPRASLLLIGFQWFLASLNFVIVVPTAAQYAERLGADEAFGGTMVGIVMLLAIPGVALNYWMLERMSLASVLYVMACGSVAGNVLYALAGLIRSKWALLASRALLGVCVFMSAQPIYSGRAVGAKHRSMVMLGMNTASSVAYTVAPLCAFLLEFFLKELRIENLVLDADTAPGWFMAVLYFVFMALVFFLFQEPPLEAGEVVPRSKQTARPRLPVLALAVASWAVFVVPLTISACDVFTAKISQRHWGWRMGSSSLFLSALMACVVPINVLAARLTRVIGDRQGILGASACCTLSSVVLLDFGLEGPAAVVLYSVGVVMHVGAASVMRGFIQALATKLVPTYLKALASTYMMACYLLGRGVGAVVGSMLTPSNFGPLLLAIYTVTTIAVVSVYGRLTPHEKGS